MGTSVFTDIYNKLCQKYPNRNIFVISDHHFFHKNIINYTRTNFKDENEMNSYITKAHNKIVEKEDIVLFLGDFCFKNNAIKEILEKMNGHKFLVLGNHDKEELVRNYPSLGLEQVFLTPVKIQNDYFSHEPLMPDEKKELHFQMAVNEFLKCTGAKNYHGHIHTKEKIDSRIYQNVTCESLDYKPLFVGRTKTIIENKEPLFINSSYLEETLLFLRNKYSFDSRILLNDYIYATILESSIPYQNQFFVQGSYGLLKKYNFISKFSDLDISCFYNPEKTKAANCKILKSLTDNAYQTLKNVESLNMRFVKCFSSMRIFETLYTSKQSHLAKGYFDANLIDLDCYKPEDFMYLEGKSLIEIYLFKSSSSLLRNFKFPHFTTLFLTPEGDLANLLLQYIFEQGHEEKKILLMKKIHYVYSKNFEEQELKQLLDACIRFFLRNLSFMATMRRYKDVLYIKDRLTNRVDLSVFPIDLQEQLNTILYAKDSFFLEIYKEVCSVEPQMTKEKCCELIRQIKEMPNL